MNASHRLSVPLDKAYRLLNHGPTVLVSAAHGGQRNIMAAAWAMPLDFAPPKVAVVLDKSTWTRVLLEGAGSFALQVPTRAQLDLTEALGNSSGREIVEQSGHDKFAAYGLQTFRPGLPWAGVLAAQADSRVFANGRWNFDGHDELRTLHHVAGGHFIVDGEAVDARPLPPVRS